MAYFVDQEYTGYNDAQFADWRSTTTVLKVGQGFKPTLNHQVTKVNLRLGVVGTMPSANMYVTIETDNAGSPSGTILGTSAIVNTNTVTGNAWYTFTFTTPTEPLTVGVPYWIVLDGNPTVSLVNYIQVKCNVTDGYPGGIGKVKDATTWSTYYDFGFQEFYSELLNTAGSFMM